MKLMLKLEMLISLELRFIFRSKQVIKFMRLEDKRRKNIDIVSSNSSKYTT